VRDQVDCVLLRDVPVAVLSRRVVTLCVLEHAPVLTAVSATRPLTRPATLPATHPRSPTVSLTAPLTPIAPLPRLTPTDLRTRVRSHRNPPADRSRDMEPADPLCFSLPAPQAPDDSNLAPACRLPRGWWGTVPDQPTLSRRRCPFRCHLRIAPRPDLLPCHTSLLFSNRSRN
jgi:hypothetical protein